MSWPSISVELQCMILEHLDSAVTTSDIERNGRHIPLGIRPLVRYLSVSQQWYDFFKTRIFRNFTVMGMHDANFLYNFTPNQQCFIERISLHIKLNASTDYGRDPVQRNMAVVKKALHRIMFVLSRFESEPGIRLEVVLEGSKPDLPGNQQPHRILGMYGPDLLVTIPRNGIQLSWCDDYPYVWPIEFEPSIRQALLLAAADTINRGMPQLRTLELWYGKKGHAAVFRYHGGIISWRGTWEFSLHDLDRRTLNAWNAVSKADRGTNLQIDSDIGIDEAQVKSIGDAIHHLGLVTRVIDPESLERMRREENREPSGGFQVMVNNSAS